MAVNNFRPRITKEEFEIIEAWRKKRHLPELLEQCKAAGIDLKDVKHYWHKSEKFSIFAKNNPVSIEKLFEPILKELQSYSPKFKPIKRHKTTDPHALVLDPADVHVGKYAALSETGVTYDIQKAVDQVDEGIDGILSKVFGFNIDKVIFVIGNDCLHTDNPFGSTTKGTKQDVSGMWHEAFIAAKEMYIRAIERILPYSDVEIVFNPSNHDYVSGFMLAQTLEAYFRWSKNVKFNVSIEHRKYTRYGVNMIVTTHGDGAPLDQLPLLTATEHPKMWNDCRFRYIYLHHIHHKQVHKFMSGKDFIGITAEFIRTPSPSDSWHTTKGFKGAKKAVEALLHSFDNGQVARLTHHV